MRAAPQRALWAVTRRHAPQVNCPGCFLHALPALAAAYDELPEKDRSRLAAVATAFEDFDLNTPANAEQLLARGALVGETRHALEAKRSALVDEKCNYTVPLKFAFGVDRLQPFSDPAASESQFADALDVFARAIAAKTGADLVPLRTSLMQQNRSVFPAQLAHTFWRVGAQGTPTWVLLKDGRIARAHTGASARRRGGSAAR